MQLTCTAVVLGSLAALASAATKREFQFPDSVPLSRRQPSGPEYQCHANCGYTILNADEEGYCDSDEWKKLLADCLKCADQYDMWGDYGDGVKGVAKACGIDAEPQGASAGSATGTSAVAATTVVTSVKTSAAETSTEEPSAEETTAAAETTSAATVSSTAAEETAATTSESSADANSTPAATPTTTENDNAAPNFGMSGALAIGAALVAAAGLL